jgi:hypothetical protein
VAYQADLCGSNNKCMFLPAAGATIQLFKDGAVWRRVTANDAGRISLEVPPGNYWARATLPSLHWQSPRSAAVEINRGGAADITGAFLPRRVS